MEEEIWLEIHYTKQRRKVSYYTIGEKAGKAWSVGAGLMKNEE